MIKQDLFNEEFERIKKIYIYMYLGLSTENLFAIFPGYSNLLASSHPELF